MVRIIQNIFINSLWFIKEGFSNTFEIMIVQRKMGNRLNLQTTGSYRNCAIFEISIKFMFF